MESGSTAHRAGLREGDIIQSIRKVSIHTLDDVRTALQGFAAGGETAILVRRGQQTLKIVIKGALRGLTVEERERKP